MLMKEIRAIAKQKGINKPKMKKTDMIRAIQQQEGNMPCYQTGRESCDQYNCWWREDCMHM